MEFLNFKIKRILLIILLLFVTVGCDQATKVIARDSLKNLRTFSFFKDSVVFQYTENTGAFLSLGSALPDAARFWIFVLAVGIFLSFTLGHLFRKSNMDLGTTLALTFLTGGGIGNLIDRALKGSVTDFVYIGWGSIRTGVFNLADVAIVAGIILYMMVNIRKKKPQTEHKKSRVLHGR